MIVAQRTPERLELRKPRWFAGALAMAAIGGLFPVVGLYMARHGGQIGEIHCRRAPGGAAACTITRETISGKETIELQPGETLGARVQSVDDEDSDEAAYRLLVQTGRGELELVSTATTWNRNELEAEAERITEFVSASGAGATGDLTVRQDLRFVAWLFGALFGGTGIAILVAALRRGRQDRWLFDRPLNLVARRTRRLLGASTAEWPLDSIVRASLSEAEDDEGEPVDAIALELRSGGELRIDAPRSLRARRAIVSAINQFLGGRDAAKLSSNSDSISPAIASHERATE